MFSKTLSGTLLIAGTTIGAGMLGIPLVTAQAGFLPAVGITVLVWAFMLATGFLYLETTLWMHKGANILSMSYRFLGKTGRAVSGSIYLFLYYCLMIAYFAAGAPIFISFLQMEPSLLGNLVYGVFFGGIIVFGIKVVDRINYILFFAMILAYLALVGVGSFEVSYERLVNTNYSKALFAAPILFSAFGFHNVIPSLTTYFDRDPKVLRKAIFFGTLIPLIVYLVWQWLIIGVVPEDAIQMALAEGKPATAALQSLTGNVWITGLGKFFALFAILTSMLGVAFSMVDFIADGMKIRPDRTITRVGLTFLVFAPPFLLTSVDPKIFVTAIGFAGGFGEAFLNGMLPALMVWMGRYRVQLGGERQLFGKQPMLIALLVFSVLVMVLEVVYVVHKH